MTRNEKIKAGKIWQVYRPESRDKILCEGSETKCRAFIRNFPGGKKQWSKGELILGQLIYEID